MLLNTLPGVSIHNNVVVVVVCEHGVSPAFEDPVPCLKVNNRLLSSCPSELISSFSLRPSQSSYYF